MCDTSDPADTCQSSGRVAVRAQPQRLSGTDRIGNRTTPRSAKARQAHVRDSANPLRRRATTQFTKASSSGKSGSGSVVPVTSYTDNPFGTMLAIAGIGFMGLIRLQRTSAAR